MTEEMRRSTFADFLGVSRAYISQLASAGRLVLSADGKQVRVQESLELIAATGSADKMCVSARHALERWKKGGHGVAVSDIVRAVPPSVMPRPEGGKLSDAVRLLGAGNPMDAYNAARAANEIKRGEQLDIDLALARKALIEQESTIKLITDLAASTRAAFERIPDRIAPQLAAETDPRVVYAMLEQAIEMCCETLSKQVEVLASKL